MAFRFFHARHDTAGTFTNRRARQHDNSATGNKTNEKNGRMNRKRPAGSEAGKTGPDGIHDHVTVPAGGIAETREASESFSVRRTDVSRFAGAKAGRKKSRDPVARNVRFLPDAIRSPLLKRGERFPYRAKRAGSFRYALPMAPRRTVQVPPAGSPMSWKRTFPSAGGNLPVRPTASVRIRTFLTIPETELSG